MAKKYTWDEVRLFLKKELQSSKSILTFGTIGSCNIDHDIDIIVTKKPRARSSDFYAEIHTLFFNLNSYLTKKYNARLIRFSCFNHEKEVEIISKKKQNDLLFHVMTYLSLPQMDEDWTPNLICEENVSDLLKKHYDCILGKTKDLFLEQFNESLDYGSLFLYLNDLDRINAHFPEDVFLEIMNSLFDFVLRKKLKQETLIARTPKEAQTIFYKVCDILDDLEKKKK